jgi:hypothetical protein
MLAIAVAACSGTTTDSAIESGSASAGRAGAASATGGAGHGGIAAGASAVGGRGGASAAGRPGAQGGTAGLGGRGAGAGGSKAGAGGSSGAAAGSGGADAGTGSTCESARYALCEDFESTDVGEVPSDWMQRGEAEVASEPVHRGSRALRVAPAGTGQRRIVRDITALGATSGTHWGRVYYRVKPQPTPTDRVIHATFVALHGDSPNHDDAIEVRVVDTVANVTGKHQFLFNVEPDGARGEFGDGSSYDWTLDGEWHCAEWRVSHGEQAYQFFIDGDEVDDIAQDNGAGNYDNTELPERFDSVAVGINNYQDAAIGGSPGYEMWLDDFAIDGDRIGCE